MNNGVSHSRRIGGFSLIELMITVAIVSILGAVAYPSYTSYTVKANRAAAKSFIVAVANREQQYIMDARAYGAVTSNAEFGTVLGMAVPAEVSNFYNVTVAVNARTFTITGIPISTKVNKDDGTLTLDQTGAKLPADKW